MKVELVLQALVCFINLSLNNAVRQKPPTTQKELVELMKDTKAILDDEIADFMLKVDRKHYVKTMPYSSFGYDIGYGAEITAPAYAANALDLLKYFLIYGSRALDIGSGSGYVTACMAMMLGEPGYVVGIDHVPSFAQKAYNNVMSDNPELITSGKIKFITGDGRLGAPDHGPYDAIYVGGTMTEIPQVLIDQIKIGGRMLIPVQSKEDRTVHLLMIVDRDLYDNITVFDVDQIYHRPLRNLEDQNSRQKSDEVQPIKWP